MGQVAWLGNFVSVAGLLGLAFRKWRLAMVCSGVALLIGCATFTLFGKELPGDEGGVSKLFLRALGAGFYVWMGSLLVPGIGGLVGVLCEKSSAAARASSSR